MGKPLRKPSVRTLLSILFFSLVRLAAESDTAAFTIIDDPSLDQLVEAVRADFLEVKPHVDRLDATLLVPDPDGTWRRGSYNPEAVAYPASVVKLAYLASAMHWERVNGLPYEHLDNIVRPMIADSSNIATGEVVDVVTGAPNYKARTIDATWLDWYADRLFTEDYLEGRGLLGNQTVLHKTYPTNSGNVPAGAEKLAIDFRGGNRMQPRLSASLLLEIVFGAIEPGANGYMRELLRSDRWGGNSSLGFGLPPGTVYENKIGLAYDTLEDVAYVQLPNGKEFILAVYSDGFVYPETANPYPYDASLLGLFAEMVYEALGFDAGNPPKVTIDNDSPNVEVEGAWELLTDQAEDYDMFGDSYLVSAAGQRGLNRVTWHLDAPEAGLWELTVWSPQDPGAGEASYEIHHDAGLTIVAVDQTVNGGRWVRLGDFDITEGTGSVVLSGGVQTILADAVRITKWPEAACIPTPEVCSDGEDNDCDGYEDCGDSDCEGDPSCSVCAPAGDSCALGSECCSNICQRGKCQASAPPSPGPRQPSVCRVSRGVSLDPFSQRQL